MGKNYTRREDRTIYALLKKDGMIETDEKGNAILYYNRDSAYAVAERKGEREVCVYYRPKPRNRA